MPRFHHSGDLGDVIYSLPTVRALGGGHIQLGPKPGIGTRVPMTAQRFMALKPLLEAQSYITGVSYGTQPVDVDLDTFRLYRDWKTHGLNIAVAHLVANELPQSRADMAWLTVPDKRQVASVIINRTTRWQNFRFDWNAVLAKHPAAVFIGQEPEFNSFGHPHLPHVFPDSLLEAARIIAGADLFIGNQSPLYAIAEGLKMDTVLEFCPEMPNCMFHRPNARYSV